MRLHSGVLSVADLLTWIFRVSCAVYLRMRRAKRHYQFNTADKYCIINKMKELI